MSAIDAEPFPRGAVIAGAAVIALSIGVTAVGRWIRLTDTTPPPPIPAPAHRIDLRFVDQTNGGVRVTAADDGALVAVIPPNSGGFVRGVLRALTRERRMHGLGAGAPFRLAQWSTGRVEIEDLADGQRVDLDAFGPTNRAAFLHLLPGARAT